MSVLYLAFNGHPDMGQFLGDTIVSVKAAYLMARATPCSRYLLGLSPKSPLNFLWDKFIETFHVEVVYDTFHPGNMDQRFDSWNKAFNRREIDGRKFDHYRELYRRIDGGHRQGVLCGGERGLGRKNVFEYVYYGQENKPEGPCEGGAEFADDLIAHPVVPPEYDVLIAPYAKCQGNGTFTFAFWDRVTRLLVESGVKVTVNHHGEFCEDLKAGGLYRRIYPPFKDLLPEVCRHRLVSCGNTGVGWVAGACGIPLLAMQPPDSNMQDYRYEWCGVQSLREFVEDPDAEYVVKRIQEELETRTVLTTGCFDILHAGHIRHLEESRSFGNRLVVALNSDASVRSLKGADRPIHNQAEREFVLRAMRCVDDVQVFDGDNALRLIHKLRPAVLTNGSDHKLEEIVGKDFVESYGGKVVVTDGSRTQTSTRIIQTVIKQVDVLTACREAANLSPNPFPKMKLLADQFLSVKDLPAAAADVGAYRGACSLVMRRLAPEKELHLFDTWSGNPHEDPLCHHRKGEWAADLAECKKVVGSDARTHYHVGVFPESVNGESSARFCFVVIDGDTYQTTKDAIAFFWPRLVEGGKLFIDDYDWQPCAGVRKAVDEAFTDAQRTVFGSEKTCVVKK